MSSEPPIYNAIGDGYDTTRRADPAIAATLAELLQLAGEGDYLDVACGTGNYTSALAARGGHWCAIDQSSLMLEEARGKSTAVAWAEMDAGQLEYPDTRFDGVLCTLAIHHFPSLHEPFREIARVLKPDGRFVLFTAFPAQMQGYWLCEYFPLMMQRACEQMPGEAQVLQALNGAGLSVIETRPFEISNELQDFFLYSGKYRPEIYLQDSVRAGISSFRNGFCEPGELASGLARLAADIDSGAIDSVRDRYRNHAGDYVFLAAQQP